ncbi:MAG: hypothetical protein R2720_13310 [Candidatus Nanopelagicales bacterium]
MTQQTARRLGALGAAVAIAGGALMMNAGSASAAGDPDFKKLSAPKTVTAGEVFRLKCQLNRNNNWKGAQASLVQKGATINAERAVSRKGNCTMRVILGATGKQKIRVVVVQGLGAIESKWLTIRVKSG